MKKTFLIAAIVAFVLGAALTPSMISVILYSLVVGAFAGLSTRYLLH